MTDIVTPNAIVPPTRVTAILLGWVGLWLVWWIVFKPAIFPSPLAVLSALPALWSDEGLGQAVASSLTVNVLAMLLSLAIALPLAYLSRVPLVKPLAAGLSKLRFLSPAVFFLLLLFMVKDASLVKIWMLTLGVTFFLSTTLTGVVQGIPETEFDEARLLRLNEWRATWYVVVRSTVPQVLDALRDNAAMGWGMLMMVEGFVRSEGGVGVLLLDQERVLNLAYVYAISGTILAVGILQDLALRQLRVTVCPWVR